MMNPSQSLSHPTEPDEPAARLREEKLKGKKVLKELREHSEQLDQDKVHALDPRSEVLANHFTRANENVKKAKTVDQALLDAQIFCKLSEYSKRQATQLQTGLKEYDVASFVDSLALIMRDNRTTRESENADDLEIEQQDQELDLHSLGRGVWNRYKTFPGIQFMYGNSNLELRVNKPRNVGKRAKKGTNVVKPSELTSDDVVQTEADRQIREMKSELQRRQRLNFWEFVIDPQSYTRSIENVFHSSFLVKDGHAKLDLGIEPPLILFRDARSEYNDVQTSTQAQAEEFERNSQFIMRFDHSTWLEKCKKYNIVECVLPSPNAPKWNDLSQVALQFPRRDEFRNAPSENANVPSEFDDVENSDNRDRSGSDARDDVDDENPDDNEVEVDLISE